MRNGSDKVKDRNSEKGLIERLMNIGLFAGMSSSEIEDVIRNIGVGGVRRFKEDEIVVFEGTKAKWLVPVLRGRLMVYESGASGKRQFVRTVEAGRLFGATLVTTRLEYYPGMAVAGSDCEVLFFDMAKIRELWHDVTYRKFFENLYTSVSEYVLYCWRKMSILSCKKVEDRFMLYLRWCASEVGESDVTLPFATSEECASYLGVTRTALSLAIRRLVNRGEIVHHDRSRFVIRGIV